MLEENVSQVTLSGIARLYTATKGPVAQWRQDLQDWRFTNQDRYGHTTLPILRFAEVGGDSETLQ
jgi:hypothetical protein